MNVAWALFWGGSRSTKPCVFPCEVASAGDDRYTSCVRRVQLRSFHPQIGSSSVFCNEWLFLCAWFYACLESVIADRTGMATRLLSSGVAMCVERDAGLLRDAAKRNVMAA